jgi:hypothetical protein
MPTEILNADITLEKFPGKGGWTYAPLPPGTAATNVHFNMLRVSGRIDDYVLERAQLMFMGQGRLFLPVKAAIRQQLGKQAGDVVRLVLFRADEDAPLAVSEADFRECLAETPGALPAYERLTAAQQQAWVAWVAAAATNEQKVTRAETACIRLAHTPPTAAPCLPPA